MEASAGPRGVAAYVALREDLIWALEDDQLRTLTTLTPEDLDGGRGDWALAVSEAHHFLGDSARSRAYADSAAAAYAQCWPGGATGGTGTGGRHPRARAGAGRPHREAVPEAERAGVLQPLGSGLQSAYVAYVRSRVDAMAGDRQAAVAHLRSLLDHSGSAVARVPGH